MHRGKRQEKGVKGSGKEGLRNRPKMKRCLCLALILGMAAALLPSPALKPLSARRCGLKSNDVLFAVGASGVYDRKPVHSVQGHRNPIDILRKLRCIFSKMVSMLVIY
jgi:hypothetical protein